GESGSSRWRCPIRKFSTGRSTRRARSRPAALLPSAGPSMHSTIGCVWPDPASTPRWRSNAWASSWRMCARAWRRRAPSAPPCSAAIQQSNGMTIDEMAALEPVLGASRDALESLQLERLQATLRHAYANNAAYRRKFDAAGVAPGDLRTLTDLARFPFTTKDDLREAYPFGFFSVPREQVARIHASSGTTGKPTVVGYTRNDIATWGNLVARSIRAAGGRAGMKVHVAYGYG